MTSQDERWIRNHLVIKIVNMMARVNPNERQRKISKLSMAIMMFTITVKQLNNVVVNRSQIVSFGGNWKIKWSECPSIWLIFEPAVSPTPNNFRTFNRLCKSPQLLFLKTIEFIFQTMKQNQTLIHLILVLSTCKKSALVRTIRNGVYCSRYNK